MKPLIATTEGEIMTTDGTNSHTPSPAPTATTPTFQPSALAIAACREMLRFKGFPVPEDDMEAYREWTKERSSIQNWADARRRAVEEHHADCIHAWRCPESSVMGRRGNAVVRIVCHRCKDYTPPSEEE